MAALFGVAVITLGTIPSLAVPLYPARCALCFPNVPVIALTPFVAAFFLTVLVDRSASWRAHIARAVVLGGVVALYRGMLESAVFATHQSYLTGPYRAYALAYVAGATTLTTGSWLAWRTKAAPHRSRRTLHQALGVGIMLSVLVLLIRGEMIVAASALVGVIAGVVGWLAVPRLRSRTLPGSSPIVAIVLIAFVARALFGIATLVRTGPGMAFALASDDGDTYYSLATGVLAGTTPLDRLFTSSFFPPGYSLFVTAIFGITRENAAVLVLAQATLAAGACVCLYLIARRLMDEKAARIAAALFALDANLIQNGSTITAEALLIPAILLGIWALSEYRDTGRLSFLIIGSAAVACAFITRNLALLIVPAALIGIGTWVRTAPQRYLRDALMMVGSVVLAATPTLAATASSPDGIRLTNQGAAISYEAPGDVIDNAFLIQRGINPFVDPVRSLAIVANDPGPVLAFLARAAPDRLQALLFAPAPGMFDPLVLVNGAYGVPYAHAVELLRLAGLLIGAIAITFGWHRRANVSIIAWFILFYLAAFALVFPPAHPFRYRIPIEPFFFLAEAAGLYLIGRTLAHAMTSSVDIPVRDLAAAPQPASPS